jgi:HK97 family phage major capsid protein
MKSLEEIAQLDRRQSAGEFTTLAKMLLKHGAAPNLDAAIRHERMPDRVRAVLKSPIAAETTTGIGVTADQRMLSSAFLQSLQSTGAFDAVLGAATRVEMDHRPFLVQTTALTGYEVAEAAAKPLTSLNLSAAQLTKTKAAGLLVLSKELAESSASGVDALISRELRKAVLGSVDSIFLAAMADGVTPTAATGTILGDIEAMVAALDPDSSSRLFLVLAPSVAAHLAFSETTGGQRALPGLNVNGGEVGGVRVVVSDYLPGSGSPAQPLVMMLDASQLVLASDDVGLRVAEHASVQMDTAPDMSSAAGSPSAPVGGELVSLWQVNARGLMVERRIAYAKARDTAVATMAGGAW